MIIFQVEDQELKENSNFVASWLEILRPSFNDLKENIKEEEKIKALEKVLYLRQSKILPLSHLLKRL